MRHPRIALHQRLLAPRDIYWQFIGSLLLDLDALLWILAPALAPCYFLCSRATVAFPWHRPRHASHMAHLSAKSTFSSTRRAFLSSTLLSPDPHFRRQDFGRWCHPSPSTYFSAAPRHMHSLLPPTFLLYFNSWRPPLPRSTFWALSMEHQAIALAAFTIDPIGYLINHLGIHRSVAFSASHQPPLLHAVRWFAQPTP